jgi:hypothetical protein
MNHPQHSFLSCVRRKGKPYQTSVKIIIQHSQRVGKKLGTGMVFLGFYFKGDTVTSCKLRCVTKGDLLGSG